MAYQDPYAGQYGHQQQPYGQPQYGQQQYGRQQQYEYGQYNDPAPEFNPYAAPEQPHPTYEQGAYENYGGGYRDDPGQDHQYAPRRQATQPSFADAPAPLAPKSMDERSSFDHGEFTPSPRGPKTASNLRQYRLDFQGPLWTRGGRGRCVGRFFCCTFMSIVFLVVTILLALVLFLRPPSIDFSDVAPVSSGSPVTLTSDGITFKMGLNISVSNPNFFAVNFKKITAEIFYPINNTPIGGGTAKDVVFQSNAQTNFTFPFSIDYSTSIDPNNQILLDIAKRCGILTNSREDLSVTVKITVGVQILFATISVPVSNPFNFACPLSKDDLSGLLGSTGLGGLIGRREDVSEL